MVQKTLCYWVRNVTMVNEHTDPIGEFNAALAEGGIPWQVEVHAQKPIQR